MADATRLIGKYDVAMPSVREEAIVADVLQLFAQLQAWRGTTGSHWEEIAELILPAARNTFFFGNYNFPGIKKTDRQVDATGMMALHRFSAICESLLTPGNMRWHGLAANNPYVMKDRASRLWFEQVTGILFDYRYNAMANFHAQNYQQFQSLGAFGTGAVLIDALDGREFGNQIGLRYKAMPLGELFIMENHQGIIDGFIRWWRMTALQAWKMFGEDKFPATLRPALDQQSQTPFNFLHCVKPRDDYDPERLDAQGKPWTSYYVSLEGRCLLREGGYNSFPIACSRYDQTPGEVYGRSPAMLVLPALKTLNAEKRTFLKAGHRAADPVLLTGDDGIVDFSLRPGALNKGGVNADGKPMVLPLQPGNIQISKEMMAEEKSLINDAFLVSLFQILMETPQMTATEVIERTNEKGILLAPTIGRQQSEYIGPLVHRELDVLAQLHLLPPMPPRLREAKGEYQVVHTSPLSRAMKSQQAAGFMRAVETSKELVNITQDPSYLDQYDFDVATRAIAEIQGVPESWMATDQDIAQKRLTRAKQQQIQQQIQAAPAQAAMMKAQAAVQKNQVQGGGQPQQQQQQMPGPQEQGVQPSAPLTAGG